MTDDKPMKDKNEAAGFSGLPMESLIAEPLKEACDSQNLADNTSYDFIKQIAFDAEGKMPKDAFSSTYADKKQDKPEWPMIAYDEGKMPKIEFTSTEPADGHTDGEVPTEAGRE